MSATARTTREPARRARQSAAERREAIIEAALVEFARGGLNGTSTEAIARRVGVSQPYLFRFFDTKKDLFIAAIRRNSERLMQTMQRAAAGVPREHVLEAMGRAYADLLADRSALLAQMQGYAACDDDDVRAVVREGFSALYEFVKRVSGAPTPELRRFFAIGMLMNVAAAMDLSSVDEEWAHGCVGGKLDCPFVEGEPHRH